MVFHPIFAFHKPICGTMGNLGLIKVLLLKFDIHPYQKKRISNMVMQCSIYKKMFEFTTLSFKYKISIGIKFSLNVPLVPKFGLCLYTLDSL